jgi:hypothetical protein
MDYKIIRKEYCQHFLSPKLGNLDEMGKYFETIYQRAHKERQTLGRGVCVCVCVCVCV